MSKREELEELYQKIHTCSLTRQCRGIEPNLRARKFDPQACDAELALMAQAPSERGVRKSGVHWVSEGGTLLSHGGAFLDPYLKIVGYSVDPADEQRPRPYTTNVLHCWTGPSGKRDRTPSKDELSRCKRWWVAELELIRPAVLLLLGKPASEAFARVCDIDAEFGAMLKQQGVRMTFGDLSVLRFVLPQPTAPYREKSDPYRGRSDLYSDVFSQIGQVLGV